jgi:hypothetical protein
MLGFAAVFWDIWKGRNELCFGKKLIKNPIDIIFSACIFMRYWVGLYPEDTQQMIREGVDLMTRTALKLIGERTLSQLPAIEAGDEDPEVEGERGSQD